MLDGSFKVHSDKLGFGRKGLGRGRRPQDGFIVRPGYTTFEALFRSGIARLNPNLLINGTTVTPTFRYYGGDAAAGGWDPKGYPSDTSGDLTLQAGTAPSYNQGAPGLGSDDDSVLFNGGGYFQAPGNSFADLGTNDFIVEMVFRFVGATEAVLSKFNITGGNAPNGLGWEIITVASTTVRCRISDNGSLYTDTISALNLVSGLWYHMIWAVDRSAAAGSQIYINGIASGAAVDVSAHASSIDLAGYALCIGDRPGTGLPSNASVAYAALWQSAAWLNVQTGMPAVAAERFYHLAGFWPEIAKGTAAPTSYTRATAAYLDKVEGSNRKLYYMGLGALRCCSREDSASELVKGYLAEPAGTNIQTYSQGLDNAAWTKARLTVSADSTAALDGTTTADTLVEDGTAANTHAITGAGLTVANATQYVFSCWLKAANRTWARLRVVQTSSPEAYYDLTNGVVGTTSGVNESGIEDWGNGWFRCWFSWTTDLTGVNPLIYIAEADNDSVFDGLSQDSLYVWGAQVELGAYPSSYIPTTSAAATRNKDQLTYKGDDGNLGGVGSDKRGTVKATILVPSHDNAAALTVANINDGGASADVIEIEIGTDDAADGKTAASGGNAGAVGVAGDITNGARHDISLKWRTDSLRMSVDSTQATPDTSIDPPDNLDRIEIGQDEAAAQQLGGLISIKIEKAD